MDRHPITLHGINPPGDSTQGREVPCALNLPRRGG